MGTSFPFDHKLIVPCETPTLAPKSRTVTPDAVITRRSAAASARVRGEPAEFVTISTLRSTDSHNATT
ncbi:hypothetical protein GCM10010185_69220 [Saccharothrix coeruleofusca]|uniref:Uncharacterized protein n=1 Tax=Saccharothrix coeruleofusca TaxID=33919 RepID=A0A918EGZ3_9PSEU|nr:hypothetical protein GCM10010185_69220 [Saccharothrix coeruleofusca]